MGSISQNSMENKIKNILFVGAVKPRKGILELLKIIELYKDHREQSGHEVLLTVAGAYDVTSQYWGELQDIIKRKKLENCVKFLGRVESAKLHELYKNADLFMLLSQPGVGFEGFGLVYLEAAAHGVPSIGSRDSGASDAIKDGTSGYLVNVTDFSEIVSHMRDVLEFSKISRDSCLAWAEENDIKIMIKKIEAEYVHISTR